LASLVKGLNIRLVDIFIKINMGLKELIGVIFVVGVSNLIAELLIIWRRFLLNNTDVVRADMFINYTIGTTN